MDRIPLMLSQILCPRNIISPSVETQCLKHKPYGFIESIVCPVPKKKIGIFKILSHLIHLYFQFHSFYLLTHGPERPELPEPLFEPIHHA